MRKNKNLSAILIGTLLISLFYYSDANAGVNENLKVIFTGDLHGNLENFPKIATAIKSERIENTILLDDGDWAEVSPFYMINGNNFVLDFFEKNNYDAVVLGNQDVYKRQVPRCKYHIGDLSSWIHIMSLLGVSFVLFMKFASVKYIRKKKVGLHRVSPLWKFAHNKLIDYAAFLFSKSACHNSYKAVSYTHLCIN